MGALGVAARWQEAVGLLENLERHEVRRNSQIFTTLLGALGAEWQQALELLKPSDVDLEVFEAAILVCGDAQRGSEAILLLAELVRRSLEASTKTYNKAIRACGDAKLLPQVLGLLEELDLQSLGADAAGP